MQTLQRTQNTSRPKASPKLIGGGLVLLAVFGGILAKSYLGKRQELAEETSTRAEAAAAGPFVLTAQASSSPAEREVSVLGESRPYATVTLYAKVSGYLGTITVDKGDHVKAGQVLATINAPETARQYEALQADARYKEQIAARTKQLHERKLVSDQESDQAISDASVSKARLEEIGVQKAYEKIVAPFDGTVTARFADPGALVQNAANSQTSALPVVTVSQTGKLRVTVYLDQRDAAFVKVGDPAVITVPERPGAAYKAVVTREAGELDPRSRTLLTEIELDNGKGEIVAGSFVDVTLKVKTPVYVQVPTDALVMRGEKPFVATVKDGLLHYQEVKIGDNDGEKVDVLQGLGGGETVALSLGNNLADGQHVQTAAPVETK